MKRTLFALLVVVCCASCRSKTDEQKAVASAQRLPSLPPVPPPPPPPEPPQVPSQEDFEEEAVRDITPKGIEAEIAKLERELTDAAARTGK
jgi:hypothetical protein